jgi:hypothetical protein
MSDFRSQEEPPPAEPDRPGQRVTASVERVNAYAQRCGQRWDRQQVERVSRHDVR